MTLSCKISVQPPSFYSRKFDAGTANVNFFKAIGHKYMLHIYILNIA